MNQLFLTPSPSNLKLKFVDNKQMRQTYIIIILFLLIVKLN